MPIDGIVEECPVPFLHDQIVSSRYQQSAERSLTADYFANGDAFTEGITFIYDPNSFILNRPRIKEHLSFGRGAHTCAGAPLARAEVRILMEKLFQYTSHIELDETAHGAPGNRRLQFDPSFIVRGLSSLQIKLTPSHALIQA